MTDLFGFQGGGGKNTTFAHLSVLARQNSEPKIKQRGLRIDHYCQQDNKENFKRDKNRWREDKNLPPS